MADRRAMFDLTGKRAVVTGAGSGIGRAFSLALAAFGAHVVATDRNETWAKETAELVAADGGLATTVVVDVTDAGSVSALADALRASAPRVDVLVNNAGIATPPARTHEMPVEDWDRLMAVNLRGVFLTTRAVLPLMLGGRGSIVNVASIVGMVGYYPSFPSAGSNYAASKAGVVGFTRQVAAEYARDGVRANAIAPGWHEGTRLGGERRALSSPETLARFDAAIFARTPMGRKGTTDELEGLVVYLASDAARFVTGQVFGHDGGWLAT
jgi:NAD(P)-dependent dehydrogenase (short-subunit alcohol dehydrogenase family)